MTQQTLQTEQDPVGRVEQQHSGDEDVGAQVRQLRDALTQQQQVIAALQARDAQQQAEIAALRVRMEAADAIPVARRVSDAEEARQRPGGTSRRASGKRTGATSRRKLLAGAGAAAAAATVALVASEQHSVHAAPANDGNSLLLGSANDANNRASTRTTLAANTSTSPDVLLKADVSNSTYSVGGAGPTAIAGFSSPSGAGASYATGVFGNSASGYGVRGASTIGRGVFGQSTDGNGVQGFSTNAIAVWGYSDGLTTAAEGAHGESQQGIGVHGVSTNYYGVLAESTNGTGLYAQVTGAINTSPALSAINKGTGLGADIQGANNGIGVYGHVGGVGGTGVYGYATGSPSIGVYGTSNSGFGVVGESNTGVDVWVGGSSGRGRLRYTLQSTAGAPTSGTYNAGEQIRDKNGELWLCTAGDGSNVGTWVKVAHLAPGATAGGATTYLAKPTRLLDTRTGASDALNKGGGPLTNQQPSPSYTLTVAGVSYNSVTVPSTAVGAIGNVTVVASSGGPGYVSLVPSGAGFQGTSNINYVSNQTIANFFIVGLGNGGKIDIYVGGAATDVIIDLFAVVS